MNDLSFFCKTISCLPCITNLPHVFTCRRSKNTYSKEYRAVTYKSCITSNCHQSPTLNKLVRSAAKIGNSSSCSQASLNAKALLQARISYASRQLNHTARVELSVLQRSLDLLFGDRHFFAWFGVGFSINHLKTCCSGRVRFLSKLAAAVCRCLSLVGWLLSDAVRQPQLRNLI